MLISKHLITSYLETKINFYLYTVISSNNLEMGKFILKEINGDLFEAKTSMAHCVGADLKMGMGIAVKFKQLFGGEAELKRQNVRSYNKDNVLNNMIIFYSI